MLAGCALSDLTARIASVAAAATAGLLLIGALGAYLGGARRLRAAVRVLFGGWLAMGITYGIGKAFGGHIV